jgi:hypothetical protein
MDRCPARGKCREGQTQRHRLLRIHNNTYRVGKGAERPVMGPPSRASLYLRNVFHRKVSCPCQHIRDQPHDGSNSTCGTTQGPSP